jgi:glycosyltransferase involved in cell wall biosynthesis
MKVCYFGAYDQSYVRNNVIRRGLTQNGIEYVECHIRKLSYHWIFINFLLLLKWLTIKKDFSTVLVSETDFVFVPLARVLCNLWGKGLILDAYFSYYDMAVNDRKITKAGTLAARRYHFFDELGCRLADRVLLDTATHARYFSDEFNVPETKTEVVRVGADETIYFPANTGVTNNRFLVLFTGTYIPLHGIETIINAASVLKGENIDFLLIGDGQTKQSILSLTKALSLNNVRFINHVPENELAGFINKADLCLGIFGATDKARRVVPCKIYNAIACAKPVVTMDSPAIRECFTEGKDIALCKPNDPASLAEKILELKNDGILRKNIAENGYQLFLNNFTAKDIVKPLTYILKKGANQ